MLLRRAAGGQEIPLVCMVRGTMLLPSLGQYAQHKRAVCADKIDNGNGGKPGDGKGGKVVGWSLGEYVF